MLLWVLYVYISWWEHLIKMVKLYLCFIWWIKKTQKPICLISILLFSKCKENGLQEKKQPNKQKPVDITLYRNNGFISWFTANSACNPIWKQCHFVIYKGYMIHVYTKSVYIPNSEIRNISKLNITQKYKDNMCKLKFDQNVYIVLVLLFVFLCNYIASYLLTLRYDHQLD